MTDNTIKAPKMSRALHPKFLSLCRRVGKIYRTNPDMVLIGRLFEAYKGPVLKSESSENVNLRFELLDNDDK